MSYVMMLFLVSGSVVASKMAAYKPQADVFPVNQSNIVKFV